MEIVPTSIAESICGTSCLGLSGQKNGDITCRMEGSGQISSLGLRDLGVPPSKNVNFNCSFHVAVKRALRPRFMPAARRVIRLLSCPSVPNRIRCRRAPVWGAALRVASAESRCLSFWGCSRSGEGGGQGRPEQPRHQNQPLSSRLSRTSCMAHSIWAAWARVRVPVRSAWAGRTDTVSILAAD